MLVPGILSVQEPHAIRNVETIPVTMILAGLGGIALVRWLGVGREPAERLRLRSAIGAAALIAIVSLNVWRYFVVWPATLPAYSEFYVADTAIGELAQALAGAPEFASRGYQVFIPAARSDEVLKYLTSGLEVGTFEGAYFSKRPGEHALLIAYGRLSAPERAQALQALGVGAKQLGEGPRSPLDGLPEFVIYGHDDAAPAVARVLAEWNRP
jgi:hypothetical protein